MKMVRAPFVAAVLVAVVGLTGCSSSDNGSITDVSAQQAQEVVAQDDVRVLDVRTPEEFAQGHLEGAINIDVNSADFASAVGELPKDVTWFVYCRSGNRSGVATDQMAEFGFTTLYDLQGGITDWANAGGKVVR